MVRVPIPDPGALLEAVAGRVDAVEAALAGLDRDVTALGRALSGINASLRDLAAPTGSSTAGSQPADDEDEPPRDWIEVTDPTTAADWLTDLHTWVETRFSLLTAAWQPIPGCWAWHPKVVVELLACRAARAAAYAAGPWPVVEFEHRHLPDTYAVVTTVLTGCERADDHHTVGIHRFHYDLTALSEVAAWWASWNRNPPRDAGWLDRIQRRQPDCTTEPARRTAAAPSARSGTAGASSAAVAAVVVPRLPEVPPGLSLCTARRT